MAANNQDEQVVCGLLDLPVDALRAVFASLPIRDVAAAASSCALLRGLATEVWPMRASRRWHHNEGARWELLRQQGKHLQLYHERHQIDVAALRQLERLASPLGRDETMRALVSRGMDVFDVLTQAVTASGTSAAGGYSAAGRQQPLGVGRRHWARQALMQVRVAQSAARFAEMLEGPEAQSWTTIEQGVLLISQVHYPIADISELARYLDLLGEELKRRMQAENVTGGRKALKILNHLLFGPLAPVAPSASQANGGGAPGRPAAAFPKWRCTLDIDSVEGMPWREGRGFDAPQEELLVPPPGYGLGLKGNREDYPNPRNSLLPAVLMTRLGIPISLAAVHMLVGRRAGLPLHLMNMPMHVISCMWSGGPSGSATAANGSGPSGSAFAQDEASDDDGEGSDLAGEDEAEESAAAAADEHWSCPETLYIDSYNDKIMDKEELRDLMSTLGLGMQPERLQPLTPQAACQRMCANLAEIYSSRMDNTHLKAILELVCGIAKPKDRVSYKSRIMALLVASNCFDGALRIAEELGGMLQAEDDPDRRWSIASHLAKFQVRVQEHQAQYLESIQRQNPRPPPADRPLQSVLFCVGEAVRHKRYHYRGVIMEWDVTCSAKEEWMAQMRVDSLPGGRMQPFYRVLVDCRDRFPPQVSYIAQCNIEPLPALQPRDTVIVHPDVGMYFDAHDGRRYIANEHLRHRFPDDGGPLGWFADGPPQSAGTKIFLERPRDVRNIMHEPSGYMVKRISPACSACTHQAAHAGPARRKLQADKTAAGKEATPAAGQAAGGAEDAGPSARAGPQSTPATQPRQQQRQAPKLRLGSGKAAASKASRAAQGGAAAGSAKARGVAGGGAGGRRQETAIPSSLLHDPNIDAYELDPKGKRRWSEYLDDKYYRELERGEGKEYVKTEVDISNRRSWPRVAGMPRPNSGPRLQPPPLQGCAVAGGPSSSDELDADEDDGAGEKEKGGVGDAQVAVFWHLTQDALEGILAGDAAAATAAAAAAVAAARGAPMTLRQLFAAAPAAVSASASGRTETPRRPAGQGSPVTSLALRERQQQQQQQRPPARLLAAAALNLRRTLAEAYAQQGEVTAFGTRETFDTPIGHPDDLEPEDFPDAPDFGLPPLPGDVPVPGGLDILHRVARLQDLKKGRSPGEVIDMLDITEAADEARMGAGKAGSRGTGPRPEEFDPWRWWRQRRRDNEERDDRLAERPWARGCGELGGVASHWMQAEEEREEGEGQRGWRDETAEAEEEGEEEWVHARALEAAEGLMQDLGPNPMMRLMRLQLEEERDAWELRRAAVEDAEGVPYEVGHLAPLLKRRGVNLTELLARPDYGEDDDDDDDEGEEEQEGEEEEVEEEEGEEEEEEYGEENAARAGAGSFSRSEGSAAQQRQQQRRSSGEAAAAAAVASVTLSPLQRKREALARVLGGARVGLQPADGWRPAGERVAGAVGGAPVVGPRQLGREPPLPEDRDVVSVGEVLERCYVRLRRLPSVHAARGTSSGQALVQELQAWVSRMHRRLSFNPSSDSSLCRSIACVVSDDPHVLEGLPVATLMGVDILVVTSNMLLGEQAASEVCGSLLNWYAMQQGWYLQGSSTASVREAEHQTPPGRGFDGEGRRVWGRRKGWTSGEDDPAFAEFLQQMGGIRGRGGLGEEEGQGEGEGPEEDGQEAGRGRGRGRGRGDAG